MAMEEGNKTHVADNLFIVIIITIIIIVFLLDSKFQEEEPTKSRSIIFLRRGKHGREIFLVNSRYLDELVPFFFVLCNLCIKDGLQTLSRGVKQEGA